jgi:tRNA G46 methylase TrmB
MLRKAVKRCRLCWTCVHGCGLAPNILKLKHPLEPTSAGLPCFVKFRLVSRSSLPFEKVDMRMKNLSLNDLPRYSDWPARLLGLSAFKTVQRNHAKIETEYSKDKWQKCDDLYETSHRKLTAHDLRNNYHEFTSGDERPCLIDGELRLARIAEVMPIYDKLIVDAISDGLKGSETLVELGCGPGFIMSMLASVFPKKNFRGGDFADSAITLAAKLYAEQPRVSVEKVDFYADTYNVIKNAEGPVTVFTCQALEQIPTSAGVLDTLSKYKDKITRVVHLEPGYALYDNSLLGLMRKRYIEINDYNRDLVPALRARKDIEILRCDANVIGWNPYNALAAIEWRFR